MARTEDIEIAAPMILQAAPDPNAKPAERGSSSRGGSSNGNGRVPESQMRTRRLFSFLPLFCFSLTYMAVWEGVNSMAYFALYNGGPTTFLFSFVVVFCGALSQAASLAEMSSLVPVAGAQYHWTYRLAPPRARRLATWVQAWSTWFGYLSLLAGVANVTAIQIEAVAVVQLLPDNNNNDNDNANGAGYDSYGYTPGGWHTSALIAAVVVPFGLLNAYGFRVVPRLELAAAALHVVLFVAFVVVLAVYGHHNDAAFIFLRSSVSSGWGDNAYVAWNLGMLSGVWSFTGFDSVVHMSEETRQAKSAVPRAMFWSILLNGILGLVMVIMLLSAMDPTGIEALLSLSASTASPITTILLDITGGSRAAATALSAGLVAIALNVNVALVASASRLTWAWARDGGLPAYFAHVHPRHRVPQRAVALSVLIVCALGLLNLGGGGGGSYVAFGAIAALGSLALYLSYAIAIASVLHARWRGRWRGRPRSGAAAPSSRTAMMKPGRLMDDAEWNLGRYGAPVNVFALAYTLYAMVWLPFPSTLPVTASNMNYCGPAMLVVLLVTLVLWFAWARKGWAGPNLTILEFIVANS